MLRGYVMKGCSMSINPAGLWESDNSFVKIFKTFAPSCPNHQHLVPCRKSSKLVPFTMISKFHQVNDKHGLPPIRGLLTYTYDIIATANMKMPVF